MELVQFENRLLVLIQWSWNYFTFNRSARLMTGRIDRGGHIESPLQVEEPDQG